MNERVSTYVRNHFRGRLQGEPTNVTTYTDGIELWYFERQHAKVNIQNGYVFEIERAQKSDLYAFDAATVK